MHSDYKTLCVRVLTSIRSIPTKKSKNRGNHNTQKNIGDSNNQNYTIKFNHFLGNFKKLRAGAP